jgi:hypothetical protein
MVAAHLLFFKATTLLPPVKKSRSGRNASQKKMLRLSEAPCFYN